MKTTPIVLVAAVGALFALSTVPAGRVPRLVSIEEFAETGDLCERPDSAAKRAALPEENLFAVFEETPVYAQDDSGSVDVTRPPVRDIRDTAPIYSSVGVDTQHNEVFLQDSNT